MPVTRRGNLYDNLDQTNTAGFLFRDDESSIDMSYAAIDGGEDSFPQLYAQKGNPTMVSHVISLTFTISHSFTIVVTRTRTCTVRVVCAIVPLRTISSYSFLHSAPIVAKARGFLLKQNLPRHKFIFHFSQKHKNTKHKHTLSSTQSIHSTSSTYTSTQLHPPIYFHYRVLQFTFIFYSIRRQRVHTRVKRPNCSLPQLSASSAAVDLASQLPSGETTPTSSWGNMSLHRQQLSISAIGSSQMDTADSMTPAQPGSATDTSSVASRPFRHSLDVNQYRDANIETVATVTMPPQPNQVLSTPPKLQTSFSAGEIPTAKSVSSATMTPSSNANAHANNHFHHHNASIGRIPPGAVKRHSRELSTDNHAAITQAGANFHSIQSALQGGAPAFGPIASSQTGIQSPISAGNTSTGSPSSLGYPQQFYPGYNQGAPNGNGYNMNMLTLGMQNMGMSNYPQHNFNAYGAMYQGHPRPRDSQQLVIQSRRGPNNEVEPQSQYANKTVQELTGMILGACKDQYGCRNLQKHLENRIPEEIHQIWLETNQHIVGLMTDPFGNYLCQKLLEYCDDNERTALIRNSMHEMITIALNQHGTRALQKMIEFVSTPIHVQLITQALRDRVVELIQDLNGNHVIQKCLNKFSAEDAQFIFEAVGNRCIDVGTHRHGCCVLQRCIDHATGEQKLWLVQKITENAQRLVQDPFGNYVVQYIIDLNESAFTEPLVQRFRGTIGMLSRHKFSSNVIEKCLRCGNDESKDMMVSELLHHGEMERLLRDSYGNYVVQTALEHATEHMKIRLVEAIRPYLHTIKTTPYGRRLQAKIQQYDSRTPMGSGQTTPTELATIPARPSNNRTMVNPGLLPSGNYINGLHGTRGRLAYPSNNPVPGSGAASHAPPQPPRLNQFTTYPGAGENGGFI